MLAKKYADVSLRFLPIIIVAIFIPAPYNLSMPFSVNSFILFLVTLILCSLVLVCLLQLIHVIAFFTNDGRGISQVLFLVAEVMAGGFIPLPLMPDVLQKIGYLLHFRLIGDLPFRVYSGNININDAFSVLLISAVFDGMLYVVFCDFF